jgi:hypothetical protein
VALSEVQEAESNQGPEYTVVGVVNDGTELNQAVMDIRELGISGNDLTVVLKRTDPDEPEPLPEGTRYIVVPDDGRGLEIPIGFAIVFVITALLFAFTTPGLGVLSFLFFIAVAVVLVAGVFAPVGVDPILQDMQVPAEDSELWNEAFEKGSVLVFANTTDRSTLRPIWEALRRQEADFYVIERRLEPQPVSGAILRWAGEEESQEERVAGAQEA